MTDTRRQPLDALPMVKPVRLQLSRAKGFNLQALSLATNGLPAVKVCRPSIFGNPFTVAEAADVFDCRTESAHIHAVDWFLEWISAAPDDFGFTECAHWEGMLDQQRAIHARLGELCGKNLACFCKADFACHADVLLELANS